MIQLFLHSLWQTFDDDRGVPQQSPSPYTPLPTEAKNTRQPVGRYTIISTLPKGQHISL
jgi:hypothetical protein